jgi:hypothetical protein
MGVDGQEVVTVSLPVAAVSEVVGSLRSSACRARVQAERYRAEADHEDIDEVRDGLREDALYCDRTAERLDDAADRIAAARDRRVACVA